ncbi:MAG TPA: NAD-dependent epimerase/dehydratase family protein [Prolixibacteraceae bacterium]
MRILITGADGMLGNNLVRLLLEAVHEVSVLIHPASKSWTLDGLKITKYAGNILISESLDEAFQNQEAVVHAAASTAVWPSRSEMVRKINMEGTRNVVEAVLRHKVGRMIYIGSGSSVNAPGAPDSRYKFPGAKYGLDYIDSKYEALNFVLDAARNRGLPALAVLPTFMIGPYDSLPGSGKMILALAKGKLKFYTRGGRNFIHVRDVATAIVNSLKMGEIGSYYIAGNENLTYQEFFAKVAGIVSKPAPKILIADWLVKTVGLLGSLSGAVLKKEPLLTYPMARISCDKQYISDEKCVAELYMPQTNIDIAIRECYDWFVENKYIK